jgi:hypothetical protein
LRNRCRKTWLRSPSRSRSPATPRSPGLHGNASRSCRAPWLLAHEEESDEYGVLRPTVFSFNRTVNLVYHAALELGECFPVGAVCTDERGGCRIEWTRAERQVRLAISADAAGRQYVYHQQGKDHSIDEEVSAARLAHWVHWLQEAE